MGLFLDLAGVLASEEQTKAAIAQTGAKEVELGLYSTQPDRTLVIFGEATGKTSFAREISRVLGVPAFAFHIHDDDLWLYEFFVGGELVDRFNTSPHYWKQLPPEEAAAWKGNADLVATHWTSLNPESIRRYLVHHDSSEFNGEAQAYPDDEFESWDCWQLTDFLRKLGIPYPDEEG